MTTNTRPVSLIQDLLDRLDSERRYEFEERAGIIEFDANQPRDTAELLSLVDLLRSHPGALVPVTVLQVEHSNGGAAVEFVITTDLDAARDVLDKRPVVVRSIVQLAEVIASEQFGGMACLVPMK